MKTENCLKILFIGDIVSKPGRRAVKAFLVEHRSEYDLVIANGENLTAGKGMTREKYQEMIESGIDFFTSGNHIWNNKEFIPHLDDPKIQVLRPANYPKIAPGRGSVELAINGEKVVLVNLQGRVFMPENLDNPFIIAKEIAQANQGKIIIIDFHAEATSEKIALGYYLDGEIAALLGTHTHVQTADERVLPQGTAYISDAGMCGPLDSVLGVEKEIIIDKFLTELPKSHKVASGEAIFNAVELEIDKKSKKAISIKCIQKSY